MKRKIAVIGLGYVGLPLAIAFARKFENVIGFDVNELRVNELISGNDRTGEASAGDLMSTSLVITASTSDLYQADFFVVAVPTPIDKINRPDLTALILASETVGRVMRKGAIVVY